MEEYYCVDLKFKNEEISPKTLHTHLFVSDKEIYFKIIDNEEGSNVDRDFMVLTKSLGFFEETFEIIKTNVGLIFDDSQICKVTSMAYDSKNNYFTVYVSNMGIVIPNIHKEFVNQGSAELDDNGLKVVNHFYSFFTNFKDKNNFSISRMNGMDSYYESKTLTFRPELEFFANDKKGSKEFTIKKIPTINFNLTDSKFKLLKNEIEVVCKFLSFCYGIRINLKKIAFRTNDDIIIYRNISQDRNIYISNFSTVFSYLIKNYSIDKILKNDWNSKYLANQEKIDKAIDNYLHSREVDSTASFLLLFNIIEIFNIAQQIEKFQFNDSKDENLLKAYELLSSSLENKKDLKDLKSKWNGLINKISIKPLKSSFEETLKANKIDSDFFGYSFTKLKKTRDKLTHGSVKSITEEEIKSQIYCLRKISLCLILSNLGFKEDLKTPYNNVYI